MTKKCPSRSYAELISYWTFMKNLTRRGTNQLSPGAVLIRLKYTMQGKRNGILHANMRQSPLQAACRLGLSLETDAEEGSSGLIARTLQHMGARKAPCTHSRPQTTQQFINRTELIERAT